MGFSSYPSPECHLLPREALSYTENLLFSVATHISDLGWLFWVTQQLQLHLCTLMCQRQRLSFDLGIQPLPASHCAASSPLRSHGIEEVGVLLCLGLWFMETLWLVGSSVQSNSDFHPVSSKPVHFLIVVHSLEEHFTFP